MRVQEKQTTVIEMCNSCMNEIEIIWDVKEDGYKIYCPVCGAPMTLCDECLHAEDNQEGKCTGTGHKCFRWNESYNHISTGEEMKRTVKTLREILEERSKELSEYYLKTDSEEEKRVLIREINTLTDIILYTDNIKALILELKF